MAHEATGIGVNRSQTLRARGFVLLSFLTLALGCQRAAPPSQFPTARALISKVQSEQECSRGLVGEAKIDYFGDEGRVRADALYVLARPSRIRFDVLSPLGGVLSTLTSDGKKFAFDDRRQKLHVTGTASQCNLTQALRVPVPPEALTQLLTGLPPVLQHESGQAQLSWSSGSYLITVKSRHRASQQLRFLPRDEDWGLPWQKQRVRLISVEVSQQNRALYRASLSDYFSASTAAPRVDPDGLEPDILPSGPQCSAELPRAVRFVVPGAGSDLLLEQKTVHHNPPLTTGLFQQMPTPGTRLRESQCDIY